LACIGFEDIADLKHYSPANPRVEIPNTVGINDIRINFPDRDKCERNMLSAFCNDDGISEVVILSRQLKIGIV